MKHALAVGFLLLTIVVLPPAVSVARAQQTQPRMAAIPPDKMSEAKAAAAKEIECNRGGCQRRGVPA